MAAAAATAPGVVVVTAVAVAEAWISRYDTRLTLLGNNCRHFAAGLASELCGRPVGPWRLS